MDSGPRAAWAWRATPSNSPQPASQPSPSTTGTSATRAASRVSCSRSRVSGRTGAPLIAWARSQPAIDPARVAIWGSSFGGGHVLWIAARDHALAAAIAQCPFTDGLASSMTLGVRSTAKVTTSAILDQLGALVGREPRRVALAGRPGSAALMTAPDALPGATSGSTKRAAGSTARWLPASP